MIMTKQSLMTVALSTLVAIAAATSNESAAVGNTARSPAIRGSRKLQEEPPMCSIEDGIKISGIPSEGGSVCCSPDCFLDGVSTCGGPGCEALPRGDGCCTTRIEDSSNFCSETMEAPCIIKGTPDGTTPTPAPMEAADVTAAPTVSPTPGSTMTTMAPTSTGQTDAPTAAPSGAEEPTMCSTEEGIEISGIPSPGGTVCCSPDCFLDGVPTCGGPGCGGLPGGDGCCATRIEDSNNFCSETETAPCIIRATTTTLIVP